MNYLSKCVFSVVVLMVPTSAWAQLEVGASYTHQTGNFGLDGFSGSAAVDFTRTIALVGEADFLWDRSRVGVFDLSTTTGAFSIRSDSQNYLGGARIRLRRFERAKVLREHRLIPFAEVLFGVSRLHQVVESATGAVDTDASDSAFTWVVGGGVEYTLTPKWAARGKLDFVRTHFVDQGQSRLRVGIGLGYTF